VSPDRRVAIFCLAALPAILQRNCAFAQSPGTQTPTYAQLDHGAVDHRGASRATSSDISSKTATIGILVPLQGTNAEQGREFLRAAQQAVADENHHGTLSDGRPFSLAVKNETGSWGQSSAEMMRLITEDQSLALIIGTNGNLAHQAEQMANKLGISIVTLASVATTTEINIPWIFRIVPSDQQQAEAIAHGIYINDKNAKVLLITTTDHDGRVGKTEFTRAARVLGANAPFEIDIDPELVDTGQIRDALSSTKAGAVVFWTDSLVFEELLDTVQTTRSVHAIYACEKTALPILANPAANSENTTVRVPVIGTSINQFGAAEQVYNAVRLIAAAIRAAGTNRARIRDALARSTVGADSGPLFDGSGNLLAKPQLVPVNSGGTPAQPCEVEQHKMK
jgi:ABC-type branched-subunit amino acid transport system substrate-binding protein